MPNVLWDDCFICDRWLHGCRGLEKVPDVVFGCPAGLPGAAMPARVVRITAQVRKALDVQMTHRAEVHARKNAERRRNYYK